MTFFLALILLLGFVGFRFWEEKRDVRVFAHARGIADEFAKHLYHSAVMGNISAEYRVALTHFLHTLAHDTVVFLVEGLRAIERPLTRLSYRMRKSPPAPAGKEPSAFLKTITPAPTPEKGRGADRSVGFG